MKHICYYSYLTFVYDSKDITCKINNLHIMDILRENIQSYDLFNFTRVSSDTYVSNDEDVEEDNSVDSFIDDRTNPTAASQPEASRIDMMAIYRYFIFPSFSSLFVGFLLQ